MQACVILEVFISLPVFVEMLGGVGWVCECNPITWPASCSDRPASSFIQSVFASRADIDPGIGDHLIHQFAIKRRAQRLVTNEAEFAICIGVKPNPAR